MRRLALLILLLAGLTGRVEAQPMQPSWRVLPGAPVGSSRNDDGFFVSPTLGWVVNGLGRIYKTTDGGASWTLQLDRQRQTYFRAVGFADSLHGWAGNLGTEEFGANVTDPTLLYATSDGGTTWTPVTNITGPLGRGVCGIRVVNRDVIYAVGRVRGPSVLMKSIDGGQSWTSQDMTAYAAGLIDAYFTSPDSGFVVGLSDVDQTKSHGVVIGTTDGGKTWTRRALSSRTGEWCWKITFPSRRVGYASLQRNVGSPVHFLKTNDGGQNWLEMTFLNSPYYVQGIGFATERIGWIGGVNATLPTYETRDGGETWNQQPFGTRLNRFRMLNDTLGYGMGTTVYKYQIQRPTAVGDRPARPLGFALLPANPNPFNPTTEIRYQLSAVSNVKLEIFDALGRRVRTLVDETQSAGSHSATFDAADLPSGLYLARLTASGRSQSQRLTLLR